jgi:hypothetical protein
MNDNVKQREKPAKKKKSKPINEMNQKKSTRINNNESYSFSLPSCLLFTILVAKLRKTKTEKLDVN